MSQGNKESGADGTVTIHLPCQFEYLRIARQSIIDFCIRAGLSDCKTAQLEMAVDEACANIIEHSYGKDPHNPTSSEHPGVQINLSTDEDRVMVEIIDYGSGYAEDTQQDIHPEEYIEANLQRGLGLYIINNFVDEVDYKRNAETGNHLRLVKLL